MGPHLHRIFNANIEHEVDGEKESFHSLFETYFEQVTAGIEEDNPKLFNAAFCDDSGSIKLDDENSAHIEWVYDEKLPQPFPYRGRAVCLPLTDAPLQSHYKIDDSPPGNLTSIWNRKTKGDTQVFKLDNPMGEVLHSILADYTISASQTTPNAGDRSNLSGPLVSISHSLLHDWGKTDPYAMGTASVDHCYRQLVTSGANPDRIAMVGHFSIPSPDNPEQLGGVVEAVKGIGKAAEVYQSPFISVEDAADIAEQARAEASDKSFSCLISGLGVIEDSINQVPPSLCHHDSILAVLGTTENPIGGSVLARIAGIENAYVPETDLRKNAALYRAFYDGIKCGWIQSAQPICEGGLAVALSKICQSELSGVDINLDHLPTRGRLSKTSMLFSESPGRVLIEISNRDIHMVEALFAGQAFGKIGNATRAHNHLVIQWSDGILLDEPIADLTDVWQRSSTSI